MIYRIMDYVGPRTILPRAPPPPRAPPLPNPTHHPNPTPFHISVFPESTHSKADTFGGNWCQIFSFRIRYPNSLC